MIRAWYEKISDHKDWIYFERREGEPGWRAPGPFPGFHYAIELAFCTRGQIKFEVNGTPLILHEGEIGFLNSLEPHRFYYNTDVECYIVVISSGYFTEINQWGNISFPTHNARVEGFEYVKRYLQYAKETWDGDSQICKWAFVDTLAHLMRRYYKPFPKKAMDKHPEQMLRAVKYIYEHYTEKLTVDEVAKQFGYSPNYFSAFFNEFMGTRFTDYLNTCRMVEYYRILKKDPTIAVGAAAQMCGFTSMNTFYRAQKKMVSAKELAEAGL